MAKLAEVTYGLGGEGRKYTYVVNDNVRVGQVLNPSVKHYKSGKIFGTTAIVQNTRKDTPERREEVKNINGETVQVEQALTAKETGAQAAARSEGGRFAGKQSATGGAGAISKDPTSGRYAAEDPSNFSRNQYIEQQRQANVASRESTAYQSFDDYSAPFRK